MTTFYNRYLEYTDDKLISIVVEKDNYQKEAVESALKIIKERGLENQLKEILENKISVEERIEQERIDSAEALKNISLNHGINVRFSDAAKIEGELTKNGIHFFRQDKNIGGGIELYPSLIYYFEEKDFEMADKISMQLGITDPYLDNKPSMKFELKIIIAVVIVIALGFLLFF